MKLLEQIRQPLTFRTVSYLNFLVCNCFVNDAVLFNVDNILQVQHITKVVNLSLLGRDGETAC